MRERENIDSHITLQSNIAKKKEKRKKKEFVLTVY